MVAFGLRQSLVGTLIGIVVGPLMSASLYAEDDGTPQQLLRPTITFSAQDANVEEPKTTEAPTTVHVPTSSGRSAIHAIVEQEALKANLPPDIVRAVVMIESGYDPKAMGRVGEIGLMQVKPATAAMLGFRGSTANLAEPEVNIRLGVTYLSQAWRLARGDLCRTLMKYRAGHGEEVMSPLSVAYCNRARSHLAFLRSPFPSAETATFRSTISTDNAKPEMTLPPSKAVQAWYKRGTPAASRAFWTAHEARIHAITAQIRSRWSHVASR